MQVALIPLKVSPGEHRSNLSKMSKWVERLHAVVDLLIFPMVNLDKTVGDETKPPELETLMEQEEVFRMLASKRRVALAGGFAFSTSDGQRRQTLILVNQRGEKDSASRVIEDVESITPFFINKTVRGLSIALCAANSLADHSLPDLVDKHKTRLLVVPMWLAGSQNEVRRIAIHNPPAALQPLMSSMSEVACRRNCWVVATNAISEDTQNACGACGGVFVINPKGDLVEEKQLYDETVLEIDVS